MNSVEATRIMAVLDETLDNLRMMSYITPSVLLSAEQLVDVLGPEVGHVLIQHRNAAEASKGYVTYEPLAQTTLHVTRLLKANPAAAAKIETLQTERSPATIYLSATLKKLRDKFNKRLSTTVEEENSNRDHFEEVQRREEKAGKEKLSLEQQLGLEKKERRRQMQLMNDQEKRATDELATIKETTDETLKQLEGQAKYTKDMDLQSFSEREVFLTSEVAKLRMELDRVQKEHREEEAVWRKKKTKAENEVGEALKKYDDEMGEKQQQLQDVQAMYANVQLELKEYEEGHRKLKEESDAFTAKEREANAAIQAELDKQQKFDEAASLIQNLWKQHKTESAPP
eukprot:CAMPEP_0182866424 /NCGR_PEP_ID=MMETSP0034_2-20130328/8197_1 /TAXON_ID=156128 /ORGANISM="Nephroselmis pyriformis, Strain CCMP717" /LENGTH=341 /DNA_ID=CAMNT_0024998751 /DNA_START=201 /DNA_END=1222 /DNA_ORIENTATION=+